MKGMDLLLGKQVRRGAGGGRRLESLGCRGRTDRGNEGSEKVKKNDMTGRNMTGTRPSALEFQPSLPPTAGGRTEITDEGTYDMVKDTRGFQSHCVDSSVHTKRPRRGVSRIWYWRALVNTREALH